MMGEKLYWLGSIITEVNKRIKSEGLEYSLKWLKDESVKDPLNLDLLMAYRDILDDHNIDSQIKKAEINIHDACAKIIRKKEGIPPRLVAKAYAYKAVMYKGFKKMSNLKVIKDELTIMLNRRFAPCRNNGQLNSWFYNPCLSGMV